MRKNFTTIYYVATGRRNKILSMVRPGGEVGMRRIPAKVKKILSDRTKTAQKFLVLDSELVDWMKEQGIDINHQDLKDHLFGGCASVVNPKESEDAILHFLKCW